MNPYTREFLIWLISIFIAIALWYPVFSKIPYTHTYQGILQIVLIIQVFRWFVFYDDVIILRRGWMKALFILVGATAIWIWYAQSLDMLRIFDDQELSEIVKHTRYKSLGMEDIYNLLAYLKTLTMFCAFGLLGTMGMMILKIIARTLGFGSKKMKTYLDKN